MFKLGLIGDNIAASQAPRLHETAGRITGHPVTYERLVPADMGMTFEEVFTHARDSGFTGLNITYPYKERAVQHVSIEDPQVSSIGAVNTVLFTPDGAKGYNTDYSGFINAYRTTFGDMPVGTVCLIGTGGAGRAVAFGLLMLGARTIRLVDLDTDKADALARDLERLGKAVQVEVHPDATAAAHGADGLVNCTPLGMGGIGGSPLPADAMTTSRWAFDAVYTPRDTRFLSDAEAAGLRTLSGYELFFGQGIDAWRIFTDIPLDAEHLRREMA
ncbi:shikimate dehydrogenase family protein [Litoreibacter arenae]|uniref:Quinate/shikimate 5-dehydrogenase I delta n=1 Tax=Litoreibacter arenae DSM 19593 TaxID=1123360 RepID=S9QCP5_9RHOB|nr:shikimate dehydrogenase [Litoreibacter arenae]EPX77378.1 Quinate/shikimate 5-dehydrogenase I delta [Litoreibacter arenae DSM 19593]